MAPIALAFATLDISKSVRDLGIVVGARSVLGLIAILVGGVLADRLPRHLIVTGAIAVAGVSQAAMAALVFTHTATVPLLAVISAINGIVLSVSFPAVASLLPNIIAADRRQQAIGVLRLSITTAMVAGASIGGVLTGLGDPGWAMLLTAVILLVAPLCFARVDARHTTQGAPATLTPAPAGRASVLADLREGIAAYATYRWLWVMGVTFVFLTAAQTGAEKVLGPAVADNTIGATGWGLVMAAQTTGMMAGAYAGIRLRSERLFLVSCAAMAGTALSPLTLALAPQQLPLMVAAFFGGIGLELLAVGWNTSIQEHIPGQQLARVYSIDSTFGAIALPLGQLTAGPIALAVGLKPALIGGGVLILLSVLIVCVNPAVRGLRHAVNPPVKPTRRPPIEPPIEEPPIDPPAKVAESVS
jgi:MFS family permease